MKSIKYKETINERMMKLKFSVFLDGENGQDGPEEFRLHAGVFGRHPGEDGRLDEQVVSITAPSDNSLADTTQI